MESRPGVLVVGSSGVGKRTLLSRLISVDFEESSESSSSQTQVHGWTINTKYYTADVSVLISHLCDDDDYSLPNLPQSYPLVALLMVFDLTKLSTLVALQDLVSQTDMSNFDILLCIGNKVDRVPQHPAHDEYRRRLLNDTDEFGISGTEGSSLLESEDASLDIKGICLEWCYENNIEFVEACASNPDFDKCLSVDGDSQGVERVFGALSAHMWPGMILKSGDKINEPVLPLGEELSEEESEYELEYEVLSPGSADPWENIDERWVSASEMHDGSTSQENLHVEKNMVKPEKVVDEELRSSGSRLEPQNETIVTDGKPKEVVDEEMRPSGSRLEPENETIVADGKPLEIEKDKCYEFEDVEQLMSEIGNIRDNLRLMPDFQRREIAANLAMKMASMFGGDSDDEKEEDE
ncbi:hypothetical protein V5N11_033090 [Cardamine amara subsp. amara]|uniref:Uncharacterized protein n=1 Tax=Cardamine amara subsp. amara TaxID=228776 RepID=A0ABD1BNN5_CARAN